MFSSIQADPFTHYFKTLDLQREITQSVQKLLAHDPGALSDTLSRIASLNGSKVSEKGKSSVSARPSVADKLMAVFVTNGNKALAKDEMAKAADVTESSVHTVLYTVRKDSFERIPNPKGRGKVFRLTPEALEAASASLPHKQ